MFGYEAADRQLCVSSVKKTINRFVLRYIRIQTLSLRKERRREREKETKRELLSLVLCRSVYAHLLLTDSLTGYTPTLAHTHTRAHTQPDHHLQIRLHFLIKQKINSISISFPQNEQDHTKTKKKNNIITKQKSFFIK